MRAEGNGQLVDARELLEVAEGELLEEERRRAVQQRPPEALTACDDLDECALQQRLEDGANVDAADLRDFGTSDRLAWSLRWWL